MSSQFGFHRSGDGRLSRRDFIRAGALGGAALVAGAKGALGAPAVLKSKRPNFLLLFTDQQGLDTISANGCRDLSTPNMDRLANRGVSFMESYSTNPLCSPGRSSILCGRVPSESGVVVNGRPIRDGIPNLGQWLGEQGYDTIYAGKWHIPASYTFGIPGFRVISTGIGGQGNMCDASVSRACQAWLRNRAASRDSRPFLMVASFLQPHDICQFISAHRQAPDTTFASQAVIPVKGIEGELPPMPPNHKFDPREPQAVAKHKLENWSERQWRYYLWSYYRMVEMVDAEIGRVLQALEDSGEAENTVVFLTADHGEGRGRHMMVTKNFLYDEAAKVPMLVSCPGRIEQGKRDGNHLVVGIDVTSTVCDYAGAAAPPKVRGRSLRPLLEGNTPEWREFIAAEVAVKGRMIRTPDFKYITYYGDPVEQLFDMKNDPGEMKNLVGESKYAIALGSHRKLLREWESRLDRAPNALTPPWGGVKTKA